MFDGNLSFTTDPVRVAVDVRTVVVSKKGVTISMWGTGVLVNKPTPFCPMVGVKLGMAVKVSVDIKPGEGVICKVSAGVDVDDGAGDPTGDVVKVKAADGVLAKSGV